MPSSYDPSPRSRHKIHYSRPLARLLRRIYEKLLRRFCHKKCLSDLDLRLRVGTRIGFSGAGWVLPQDRLEACPPIPVEIRCALRVLARQGYFAR
jgi:hypothetical protein